MNVLAKLLALFGFGGKTLDKAITLMTKLDTYLEEVEKIERARITESEAQIAVLEEAKTKAADNADRATRIRERAKEFVS